MEYTGRALVQISADQRRFALAVGENEDLPPLDAKKLAMSILVKARIRPQIRLANLSAGLTSIKFGVGLYAANIDALAELPNLECAELRVIVDDWFVLRPRNYNQAFVFDQTPESCFDLSATKAQCGFVNRECRYVHLGDNDRLYAMKAQVIEGHSANPIWTSTYLLGSCVDETSHDVIYRDRAEMEWCLHRSLWDLIGTTHPDER